MVRVLRPTFRISPPGDSPDRAPKSGAPAGHHPRGGQLLRDPSCRRPEARLPVLDRRLRAGTFPRERAGSLRPAWIQIPLPQTFPRERPTRPSGRPRPRAPPPDGGRPPCRGRVHRPMRTPPPPLSHPPAAARTTVRAAPLLRPLRCRRRSPTLPRPAPAPGRTPPPAPAAAQRPLEASAGLEPPPSRRRRPRSAATVRRAFLAAWPSGANLSRKSCQVKTNK